MQSGPCPKTRFDKTFFPKIAPFSCSQVQNYILQALVERGWERWCGFWPRVGARAQRAPVFLGSLPRQTGRCAPPPSHRSFTASYSTPKNIYNLSNLGRLHQGLFSFHRGYEIWGPLPPPRPSQLRWSFRQYFWGQIMFFYILTVCCLTDMHINDIHISVILIWGGQAFFDPFGVKIM